MNNLLPHMSKFLKAVFLILFAANVAYVDYSLFYKPQSDETRYHVVDVSQWPKSESSTAIIRDSCYPYSCPELIKQATASLKLKGDEKVITVTSSSAQEFYIPFGSGETTSDTYEDVPGLQAYIDSSKYKNITKVTFEATLRIPTANGRAYAQLFNSTDKHPVWFSEIATEGSEAQLLISSPITLDQGNKLYKVQMKTTLKYQSIIDQARVHIITK